MKTIQITLISAFVLFLCLPAFPQTSYDWGLSAGSTGRDEVTDLVLDAQGNVFLTGAFEDSMDVANGGTKDYVYSNGYRDIFLSKYDANGAKQWAFSIGSRGFDRGWSMTLDDQGNVYAGGVFTIKADFDPSADSTILTANPAGFWPDGYLAKYNTNGELVWAKHLLTARDRSASQSATLLAITGMEIDNNGDLVIGGAFWDTVWLAPNQMIVSDGSLADMFLAKYDSDGNFIWAKQMGGGGDQRIQAISTDPQGNIYSTGFFFGSPYFDPAGGSVLSSQGGEDIFLAKYSSTGALLWAKGIGSVNGSPTSTESGYDVDTDAAGNVYFTGRLLGSTDFDSTAVGGEITTVSSNELFCAKWDGSGALDWVFILEGGVYKVGKCIDVQPNGDFWLAGEFGASPVLGGLDVDTGQDTVAIFSLGNKNTFAAKYDTDASFLEVREVRGLGDNIVVGLAADANEMALGGYFERSILLDRTSGDLRFARGGVDLFAVKYGEGNMAIENALRSVDFSLYPNPVKQDVNLKFSLQQAQRLSFSLYTLDGKAVQNLGQDQPFSPGHHQLQWELAAGLAPGRYLLAVTAAHGQQLLPVLIVK